MSNPPSQNHIVQLSASPAWTFVQQPIEVVATESERRSSADPAPQHTVGETASTELLPLRPTHAEMMASFRALQKQRGLSGEDEIVVEKIVCDDTPGSLLSDMHGIVR